MKIYFIYLKLNKSTTLNKVYISPLREIFEKEFLEKIPASGCKKIDEMLNMDV